MKTVDVSGWGGMRASRATIAAPSLQPPRFPPINRRARQIFQVEWRATDRGRGSITRPAICAAISPPVSSTASSSSGTWPGNEYFDSGDLRPIVLFDGVCNLCNGGVQFVLRFEASDTLRFAALQSAAGRGLLQRSGRDPEDISSIVLVDPERSYIKSDAVLHIGGHLVPPLPLLVATAALLPLPLRDALYDAVANNRYALFGRSPTCRLADERWRNRFIAEPPAG